MKDNAVHALFSVNIYYMMDVYLYIYMYVYIVYMYICARRNLDLPGVWVLLSSVYLWAFTGICALSMNICAVNKRSCLCVCVCFEDAAMFIYRLCVRDEVYWYMTIYALSHLTIDTLSLIYLDNCIVMISDKMG